MQQKPTNTRSLAHKQHTHNNSRRAAYSSVLDMDIIDVDDEVLLALAFS